MAAKRKKRSGALPPETPWLENDEYIADLHPTYDRAQIFSEQPLEPQHVVIRNRETGEIIEHCRDATLAEATNRAKLLSRGKPSRGDNQSWGMLTKGRARPGRSVKDEAITLAGVDIPTPTECVERLVRNPWTLPQLRACKKLDAAGLTALLEQVIESKVWEVWETLRESKIFDDHLSAVSMQLYEKYGIGRGGRWQD